MNTLNNIEVYEGNNPSIMTEITVNKVLDTSSDRYQIRVEIGGTVFYLNESEQQELSYMIANAY